MRRTLVVALLGLTLSTGCAGLMVHSSDPGGKKAAKIATRVLLAPISLGISEAVYACARDRGGTRAAFDACNNGMATGMAQSALEWNETLQEQQRIEQEVRLETLRQEQEFLDRQRLDNLEWRVRSLEEDQEEEEQVEPWPRLHHPFVGYPVD